MARFKELDPVLHSQLRLAVVSLLMGVEVAEFTFIQGTNRINCGKSECSDHKAERSRVH